MIWRRVGPSRRISPASLHERFSQRFYLCHSYIFSTLHLYCTFMFLICGQTEKVIYTQRIYIVLLNNVNIYTSCDGHSRDYYLSLRRLVAGMRLGNHLSLAGVVAFTGRRNRRMGLFVNPQEVIEYLYQWICATSELMTAIILDLLDFHVFEMVCCGTSTTTRYEAHSINITVCDYQTSQSDSISATPFHQLPSHTACTTTSGERPHTHTHRVAPLILLRHTNIFVSPTFLCLLACRYQKP